MGYKYDLLLRKGLVIDPVSKIEGIKDIAVSEGKIAAIEDEISPTLAKETFNLEGYHIIPGIIDTHTHASSWLGGKFGHKMLAKAGVTSTLDMSGPVDSVLDIVRNYGVGVNIACIEYVRPGHTVENQNPSVDEMQALIDKVLEKGAIGVKLLGGHYPLTTEATARAIEVINRNKAYVAFHAGSLENGSNINGFLEAVKLADGNALHLAHINSYCRGSIKSCEEETEIALKTLIDNPNISCESYLSPLNGTSAKCSKGVPESKVTQSCLRTGGYEATQEGLVKAILDGWAEINIEEGGQVVLGTGQYALEYWQAKEMDTTVSFKVNPPQPRIRLATAKDAKGDFVVDCISTDGGGIPRNVIVEMGLSLVKLEALTMAEYVQKVSSNPAKMLGLSNKGHFNIGADADITVLDYEKQKAFMTISNGQVIMYNGFVCGKGGKIITTEKGVKTVKEKGLEPIVIHLEESNFYN